MAVPWKVPVMQAPVGPATTVELVHAVSGAGALGTLAASWTEPSVLRGQLRRLRASVGSGFCVNLVLAFDQRERLEVVLDEGVGYVSFSWGVDVESIWRAGASGAVVLVQVGDVASAQEAAAAGADVIVAQGVEAGGHVEGTTPVIELVRALRGTLELPIVAAGGIADSASARAATSAGAHGVACGTAFLAALEADVHPVYVDRLLRSSEADTVLTTLFDVGWPNASHRVLCNDTYASWDGAGRPRPGSRPGENEVIAVRGDVAIVRYSDAQPTATTEGAIESMALYAGASVSSVTERRSAAEITRSIASGLDVPAA